jgi:hypothetical protein
VVSAGLSEGAKIGIGVGVTVPLAGAAILATVLLLRRRRSASKAEDINLAPVQDTADPAPLTPAGTYAPVYDEVIPRSSFLRKTSGLHVGDP